MKTKTDFTILERAIATVEGFEGVYKTLQQQVALRGQSQSTLHNYIRQISLVSLHFNCLPERVTDEELNEYLAGLALSARSPSRSAFKHAVYGLRYYFRLMGDPRRAIKLPSIKKMQHFPLSSIVANCVPCLQLPRCSNTVFCSRSFILPDFVLRNLST